MSKFTVEQRVKLPYKNNDDTVEYSKGTVITVDDVPAAVNGEERVRVRFDDGVTDQLVTVSEIVDATEDNGNTAFALLNKDIDEKTEYADTIPVDSNPTN